MDHMDFSDALLTAKNGYRIARSDWNAPGQFVVAQRGYPDGVPINQNTSLATGVPMGTVCKFDPYLMLRNAQGIFVPWVPTQGDLFSNNWQIIDG